MKETKFRKKVIQPVDLKKDVWLKYLFITEQNNANVEYLTSMSALSNNQVLKYVERTLDAVQLTNLRGKYKTCLLRTLQWSEVAKCGSERDRKRWRSNGWNLDIHNEASAEIYLSESTDDLWTTKIVYTLIKTHGLIGQYIRGETNLQANSPLCELLTSQMITPEHLKAILRDLNKAIIYAVSPDMWKDVKAEVYRVIDWICARKTLVITESKLDRLKKLFPAFRNVEKLTKAEEKLYRNIFAYHDLWYPTVALSSFSRQEINTIFSLIADADRKQVKHISFYEFSRAIMYDYDGKRKENVYKKRIIEMFLREHAEGIEDKNSEMHLKVETKVQGNMMMFNIVFTPVCESLIQFCVESERSGFMDYQKNITTIFDLFGFRRDVFDRLNNEEKYLNTMNAADGSTKLDLLKYVVGDKIVDVGSGGGVLLDILEEKYPYKTIIGTDISENVIETLEKKKEREEKRYSILQHNFVDGPLEEKVDTIIFSSILHEIFSYTEWNGERYKIESVKKALENAEKSLKTGGRILIRDGIISNGGYRKVQIKIKNDECIQVLRNYLKDCPCPCNDAMYSMHVEISKEGPSEYVVKGDINLIREFLYTYTWGSESYACEVQEQFGYMREQDFEKTFEEIGLDVIYKRILTEPGYPEHLNDKVELIDFTWDDIPSTCILVVEKRR